MTAFSTIRIDQDARGVATLTLARPERHNAMNAAMIGELAKAAAALGLVPLLRPPRRLGDQGRDAPAWWLKVENNPQLWSGLRRAPEARMSFHAAQAALWCA